jgi:outer membrane protein TolC
VRFARRASVADAHRHWGGVWALTPSLVQPVYNAELAEARVHQETGVAALQDAADLARARYETGLANYIEILTADQDLFQRQQLLAATRGAEFRARSELYRALGGGWQP